MADGLEKRLRAALSPLEGRLRVAPAEEIPPGAASREVGAGLALWCDGEDPAAGPMLAMGEALAAALTGDAEPPARDWRRRLTEDPGVSDDLPYPCCVLLLRCDTGLPKGLRGMVPLGTRDVLVPLDACSAALVRDVSAAGAAEETEEYANALRDSLLTELGCEVTLGVGSVSASPALSCRNAMGALRLGRRYAPERGVWLWRALLAERIADELPPEAASLYAGAYARMIAQGLDEELQATAAAFLQSSLNVSDTARRLYIHRSTLMYRLDKIQRCTGLDLRRFDDAMTFRLLHTIHSGVQSNPIHKEDTEI